MVAALIGNPDVFAIEVQIRQPGPPAHGSVRLWVGGLWLGDIGEPMFLHPFATSLQFWMRRGPAWGRPFYADRAEALNDPLLRGSFSACCWSEGFDDFEVWLYSVEREGALHIQWALRHSKPDRFPDYPPGRLCRRIPFAAFDPVVREFRCRLSLG